MALKGKQARLKVSTTSGGVFAAVAGIKTVAMNRDGQTVDISTLTDDDVVRLAVLKDATYTADGNYEPGDTNGQAVLETAYEDGTSVWVEYLYNGTNGWKQECWVNKIGITGGSGDKQGVSYELQGSGPKTTV